MKEVFIINPRAGKSNSLKLFGGLIQNENRGIIIPQSASDTTFFARKFSNTEEETTIYAVGGDGTLNNVLNGVVGTKAILGVVPMGSGNDFARTLEESDIPNVTTIDVGKMNHEYFLNIASVGFDANVVANLERHRPNRKFIPYPRAIIDEFLKQRSFQLIEKEKSLSKITLLAVCNGRYYGNGIKIAPNALINDGMFDVYEIGEVSKLKLLKLLYQVLKHEHETNPNIIKEMLDELDFTAVIPDVMLANLDGESRTFHKFNFSLLKDGVTITKNIPDDVKRLKLNIEGR